MSPKTLLFGLVFVSFAACSVERGPSASVATALTTDPRPVAASHVPAGPAAPSAPDEPHFRAPAAPAPKPPAYAPAPGPRAAASLAIENPPGEEGLLSGLPALFRIRASGDIRRVSVRLNRVDAGEAEAVQGGAFRFRHVFREPGDYELELAGFGSEARPLAEARLTVRVVDAPLPAPRSSRLFNAWILKAVDYLDKNYGQLGYGREAAFTHDLDYYKYGTLRPTGGGLTMCVAGVMEVILTAFQLYSRETGNTSLYDFLPFESWSSLASAGIKARIWVNPKLHSSGTADALSYYGMGERTEFRNLEPGGFVNINRTTGSGHAVVFLGFIDAKGRDLAAYGPKVAGFKYFGAQGKRKRGQGGFGYRHAFFSKNGCPNVPYARDCNVIYSEDPRVMNVGQLLAPSEWRREKTADSEVETQLPEESAPAATVDFDGLTTDD